MERRSVVFSPCCGCFDYRVEILDVIVEGIHVLQQTDRDTFSALCVVDAGCPDVVFAILRGIGIKCKQS